MGIDTLKFINIFILKYIILNDKSDI